MPNYEVLPELTDPLARAQAFVALAIEALSDGVCDSVQAQLEECAQELVSLEDELEEDDSK